MARKKYKYQIQTKLHCRKSLARFRNQSRNVTVNRDQEQQFLWNNFRDQSWNVSLLHFSPRKFSLSFLKNFVFPYVLLYIFIYSILCTFNVMFCEEKNVRCSLPEFKPTTFLSSSRHSFPWATRRLNQMGYQTKSITKLNYFAF